jgi:glutaredoxin-related protein
MIKHEKLLFFSKLECGFCQQVKNLLRLIRVEPTFIELDFIEDGQIYEEEMIKLTNLSDVPILYLQGKYIGSLKEIRKMTKDGSFFSLLEKADIQFEETDKPMYPFNRNFGCFHSKYIDTGPNLKLRQ